MAVILTAQRDAALQKEKGEGVKAESKLTEPGKGVTINGASSAPVS